MASAHVAFLLVFIMKSSLCRANRRYENITSPAVADLMCGVDQPTESHDGFGRLQCAKACNRLAGCEWFNFFEPDIPDYCGPGLCQLYNRQPELGTAHRCTLYKNENTASDWQFVPGNCSFPYTYEGQVFYNCTQNIAGLQSDSFGCLAINRTATTCDYAVQRGFPVRTLSAVSSSPVLSVFGWTVWMQRTGAPFSWSRKWVSYRNGFGSPDGDFWLGLERVHLLTSSARYRLRVELQWAFDGGWSSAEYWSFAVGSETNGQYRLDIDGFSGDVPDTLSASAANAGISGAAFSAMDIDNDNVTGRSCAVEHNCGWWFSNCDATCLTCFVPLWSFPATATNWIASSRLMMMPRPDP